MQPELELETSHIHILSKSNVKKTSQNIHGASQYSQKCNISVHVQSGLDFTQMFRIQLFTMRGTQCDPTENGMILMKYKECIKHGECLST